MADIKKVNVGGLDYNVKDDTARTNSSTALTELAYQETGNTASQAYAVIGTPINWKGTLYYLKTPVAAGAVWEVGTNLTLAPNLGKLTSNIKTYVNGSGELVFRDLTGADTVLPFSGTGLEIPDGKALFLVGNGAEYAFDDIPTNWKSISYSGMIVNGKDVSKITIRLENKASQSYGYGVMDNGIITMATLSTATSSSGNWYDCSGHDYIMVNAALTGGGVNVMFQR
ncbi:MAG: hypothetical protein J6Y86_07405 [Pseudobutyrivibrio sp.]|nr:hypothetical protein [Pseudobutyrivibrio sp.]